MFSHRFGIDYAKKNVMKSKANNPVFTNGYWLFTFHNKN